MTAQPHVLVVGSGIIGASIAWHLARSGARVTIVETGEPGGVATRASWAWINASWGYPEPYFRLRRRSMDEWRRLEKQVPGLVVSWSGALNWELPPDDLEAFAVLRSSWGYDIRRVDGEEARRLEPHLAARPEFALHVASEGAVEPLEAAQALLRAAQTLGARLISAQTVRSMELRGERAVGVDTDGGLLEADWVVIAAGVGSAALAATAGFHLPMQHSPALIVASSPCPPLLNGLVVTPEMELRQTAEGRLLAGSDIALNGPDDDGSAAAAELLAAVRRTLDWGVPIEPGFHRIGYRPIPEDGFPAIGPVEGVPGLYIATMHSGITLAPAVGRFVADEILTGRRDPLLAPYGLGRFGRPRD